MSVLRIRTNRKVDLYKRALDLNLVRKSQYRKIKINELERLLEEQSRPRIFTATFEFKYKYRDYKTNELIESKNYITATYNTKNPNEIIMNNLKQAALYHLENGGISESVYERGVEITDTKIPRTFRIQENITSLTTQPVFRSSLCYPNLKLKPDDKENGLCGYEYLLKHYPRKAKSIKHLEEFFNKENIDGLTAKDFLKFCEHYDLGLYLCDLLGNQILHRLSKRVNQRKEKQTNAIMAVIANNHIYEIDENLRNKMAKIITSNIQFIGENIEEHRLKSIDFKQEIKQDIEYLNYIYKDDIIKLKDEKPQIDNPLNGIKQRQICLNVNDLSDIYLELLKNGYVFSSKWKLETVTDIYFDNKIHISISPNFKQVKKICEDFNIQFKNQSIPSISRELFKSFELLKLKDLSGKWQQSKFNNETHKLFYDTAGPLWNSAFYEMMNEDNRLMKSSNEAKKHFQIRAIDQSKQYSYIASSGDFYYIDVLDVVKPYTIEEEITYGFYFIETDYNLPPFKKNGFYDYKLIQAGLEDNIISHNDIKYYIKGNHCKSNDIILQEFIKYIYGKSPENAKHIINTIIGSFGITKNIKETKTIITNSVYEANYYYNILKSKNTTIRKLLELPLIENKQKDIYKIQGYKELINTSSDIPIRIQIVNRGNLETYKMLKYVEASKKIPVLIKVDCIAYIHNTKKSLVKVEKNPEIGDYREEKHINYSIEEFKNIYCKNSTNSTNSIKLVEFNYIASFSQMYPFEREWKNIIIADENDYFDYKKVLSYDRVYIKGFAGSGKSYIINKLKEELKDTFLYCSYTHTAANNIDGITLHSGLGINFNNNNCYDKKIRNITEKYKGIIIDEINQVPIEIFRILNMLPSNFKMYCFGDFRQELPVETSNINQTIYINSDMFKILMNYNMIELRKMCRSDVEYGKACIEYHDKKNINIIKPFINSIDWIDDIKTIKDDINITKTNELRIYINHIKMLEYKNKNSKIIECDNDQIIYLYKGLYLVSKITDRKINIFNNELYYVYSLSENEITLKYRLLNSNPEYVNKRREEFKITYDYLKKYFSPAYAFTTYKIEGQTIDKPYTIWEWNRLHIKSKYTALTRAVNSKQITIYNMNKSKKSLYDIIAEAPEYKNYTARIYKITDGVYTYYGSTKRSIHQRYEEHKEASINGTSKFYRYIQQIGIDKFKIELVDEFNYIHQKHIYDKENSYIEYYDTINKGLNEKNPV